MGVLEKLVVGGNRLLQKLFEMEQKAATPLLRNGISEEYHYHLVN